MESELAHKCKKLPATPFLRYKQGRSLCSSHFKSVLPADRVRVILWWKFECTWFVTLSMMPSLHQCVSVLYGVCIKKFRDMFNELYPLMRHMILWFYDYSKIMALYSPHRSSTSWNCSLLCSTVTKSYYWAKCPDHSHISMVHNESLHSIAHNIAPSHEGKYTDNLHMYMCVCTDLHVLIPQFLLSIRV